LEREEFRDLGVRDETELAQIKAEVSDSNLYNEDLAPTGPEERTYFAGVFQSPTFIEGLCNYGLFFTFLVAGLAYLLLNMIPGLAPQPRREPEAT
jgi:cytosine/uracil/thiamine/allantoin permease